MPLFIIQNDICTMPTDAIVNAANSNLMHGGGVALSIARAAGEEQMAAASAQVAPCPVGGAVYTPGFALPAKYVIHAVGPIWQGGDQGEEELLRSAYRSSLELARDLGCSSLSFPLISAGIFGYPRDEAFQVAVETIDAFLQDVDMTVYMVLYASSEERPSRNLQRELDSFIIRNETPAEDSDLALRGIGGGPQTSAGAPLADSAGVRADRAGARKEGKLAGRRRERLFRGSESKSATFEEGAAFEDAEATSQSLADYGAASRAAKVDVYGAAAPMPRHMVEDELTTMLENLDASFSDAVFALIDAKGLTDPQVYNKVHMSRQSFSKLRHADYHPKKTTAIILALALDLDLEQTQELLARAGYTLSTSSRQDCVVMFLIQNGIHDLALINELLYERDLPLLSS